MPGLVPGIPPRHCEACKARRSNLLPTTSRLLRFARNDGGWENSGEHPVQALECAVIGTGWCGGIRAETLARSALCAKLHVCEIRPERLAEVKALTNPATATLDHQDIVKNPDIKVVYICTTPENTHFPIARDCLRAGKHVLLEKPVSVMVSRHLSRSLGKKIAGRTRLSPAAMESTHDLDFVFWLLEPAKPVRVYSQGAYGYMKPVNGSHDVMFTTVTMDNGVVVMIGGGWNFPVSYPNYCSTWIEITGTEGALVLDDTQRDNWLNTMKEGQVFPMSTMPGEQVGEVFAGGMGPETIHFLEACIRDTPVMVTPESARMVMETYSAADLSADRNEPIDLPLTNQTISQIAEFKQKIRAGLNV